MIENVSYSENIKMGGDGASLSPSSKGKDTVEVKTVSQVQDRQVEKKENYVQLND